MLKVSDFKVGDKVFVTLNDWRSRTQEDPGVREYTVKAVGRKYLTVGCCEWDKIRFYANEGRRGDNFLTEDIDFGSPRRLFASMEDYQDNLELSSLRRWLRCDLPNLEFTLTADQIRRIIEITEEKGR